MTVSIILGNNKKALGRVLRARQSRLREAEATARRILEDVRRNGDRALVRYARQFDGLDLRRTGFTVSAEEIGEAYRQVPSGFVAALDLAARNIRAVARLQLPRPWQTEPSRGIKLRQIVRPLERVAC